jgi:hypothetical protein
MTDKVTLILPCCGDSTRFPGNRPKFLLTHPNGLSMLAASIKGLDLGMVHRIVCVVREDHVKKYGFIVGIQEQFDERFEWCILEKPTESQPETVAMAIALLGITGPIAIKDPDNYFTAEVLPENVVATSTLQEHELINPSNKSYVEHDGNRIDSIAEKQILSDTFCCGLYCFNDADYFNETFLLVRSQAKHIIHVSDIIAHMLEVDIEEFYTYHADNYIDWGTLQDWNRYKEQFETIFVDLDGVLVQNSGQYFDPKWGTTDALDENVSYLIHRKLSGKVHIIITTSRTKDAELATINQLKNLQIPYDRILFGLPHGRRVLINDYAPSNPYPSCYAVNLPRNSDTLCELMP